MFEEQITESIEAGAPNITYSGNEGPKSPQQEQMMQQQMMEQQMMEQEQQMMAPVDYSSPAFRIQLIEKLMADEGLDYGAASQKADWIIAKNTRQGAAFGGIMGLDGRKKYGWGSKIKDRIRKLIPNEVAKVAEVAAPFVAPFNPLAAGLMSGIGGFDRTGKMGSSIKSGLMNYGMGQIARGVGGGRGNLQSGFNPTRGFGDATTFGKGLLSNPMQSSGGLGGYLQDKASSTLSTSGGSMADKAMSFTGGDPIANIATGGNSAVASAGIEGAKKAGAKTLTSGLLKTIDKYAVPIILGSMGLAAATTSQEDASEALRMARGSGLDIDGIRLEVQTALEGGEEAWAELQKKYPYIGEFGTKKAEGGRIGYGLGNLVRGSAVASPNGEASAPSGNGMGGMLSQLIQNNPNIFKNSGQSHSSGQGPGGGPMPMGLLMPPSGNYADNFMDNKRQFTASPNGEAPNFTGGGMGGMIPQLINQNKGMFSAASQNTTPGIDQETSAMILDMNSKGMDIDTISQITQQDAATINSVLSSQNQNAYGGRIGRAEGGLMNLGGMEKDYRAEGGFVPIGSKEKADDVPARLSVNEFVFTADAVRNAGGGDIDQGAEIMERVMKNLEQGGQISEETQGMSGAQEMFNVSERLSEVV